MNVVCSLILIDFKCHFDLGIKFDRLSHKLCDYPKTIIVLTKRVCWVLKKYCNKAYPSSAGQTQSFKVLHPEDAKRREIIPDLAPRASFQVFDFMVQKQ
jgi:hypothetical protein